MMTINITNSEIIEVKNWLIALNTDMETVTEINSIVRLIDKFKKRLLSIKTSLRVREHTKTQKEMFKTNDIVTASDKINDSVPEIKNRTIRNNWVNISSTDLIKKSNACTKNHLDKNTLTSDFKHNKNIKSKIENLIQEKLMTKRREPELAAEDTTEDTDSSQLNKKRISTRTGREVRSYRKRSSLSAQTQLLEEEDYSEEEVMPNKEQPKQKSNIPIKPNKQQNAGTELASASAKNVEATMAQNAKLRASKTKEDIINTVIQEKMPRTLNISESAVSQTSNMEIEKETHIVDELTISEKLQQIQSNQVGRLQQINAFNLMGGQEIPPPPKCLNLDNKIQTEMVVNLEKLIDSEHISNNEKDVVLLLINGIKSNKLINAEEIETLRKIEVKHTKAETMLNKGIQILQLFENDNELIKLSDSDKTKLVDVKNNYNTRKKLNTDDLLYLNNLNLMRERLVLIGKIKDDFGNKLINDNIKISREIKDSMRKLLEELETIQEINQIQFRYLGIQKLHSVEENNTTILHDIQSYLNYQYIGSDHKDMLDLYLERERVLNEDEIKDFKIIKASCDRLKSDQLYYERIAKLLLSNKPLEEMYPREKGYSVSIKGDGIFEFDNQMKARQREITRCTGVKNFQVVELRRQKTDEEQNLTEEEFTEILLNETHGEREIFITVKTYDDMCKLMRPWPSDAFEKGVKPKLEPIDDFQIVLNGIEKDICKTRLENMAEEMEIEYGVVNMKRQYIKNDVKYPSTTLNARILTLIQLLVVLRDGIPIDPKYRQVKIRYNEIRPCSLCGTLDHFRCSSIQKCIKCGITEHTTDCCPVEKIKQRCINCHRLGHRCDSEECNLLRIKKYKANDYILSILLGENIIRNQSEILRNPELEINEDNINVEQIKELVNTAINENERINKMDERLSVQERKIEIIEEQINTLNENQNEMMTQFADFREEHRMENSIARVESEEKHENVMTALTFILNKMSEPSFKKKSGSG